MHACNIRILSSFFPFFLLALIHTQSALLCFVLLWRRQAHSREEKKRENLLGLERLRLHLRLC